MNKTKIEWCDLTINPVVGCSPCSPGCENCYAERWAARLASSKNDKIRDKYKLVIDGNGKWNGLTVFDHRQLKAPSVERGFFANQPGATPKRIFIGSMGDVFHPDVSSNSINSILYLVAQNPAHTFLMLTKRASEMHNRMHGFAAIAGDKLFPLPNLWLGVTVCTQEEADRKIPVLLQTPAARRFISVEPMLGPVELKSIPWDCLGSTAEKNALTGMVYIPGNCGESSQTIPGKKLDWVICGGETGRKARPMNKEWAESLRDQCAAAGVPFFFKGWGEWRWHGPLSGVQWGNGLGEQPNSWVEGYYRVGRKKTGRDIGGVEHTAFPGAS